jgi:hypothetical protein
MRAGTYPADHDDHRRVFAPEPMDHIEHDVVLVDDRERLAGDAPEAYPGVGPFQPVPQARVDAKRPRDPVTVGETTICLRVPPRSGIRRNSSKPVFLGNSWKSFSMTSRAWRIMNMFACRVCRRCAVGLMVVMGAYGFRERHGTVSRMLRPSVREGVCDRNAVLKVVSPLVIDLQKQPIINAFMGPPARACRDEGGQRTGGAA